MSFDMFDTIDPSATDLVHIFVSMSPNSNAQRCLARHLGAKPNRSQWVQLDLNRSSGYPQDWILNLYSRLLEGLVLHVWPAGLRPVLWIEYNEAFEAGGGLSWSLLGQLLGTIRNELTDKTLDVVVKAVSLGERRGLAQKLCTDFKCTVCTSDTGMKRMMMYFEEAEDHVAKLMSTRWSYRERVESLPFYEKAAPWYFLTNFAPDLAFTCEDSMRRFETSEHYFQAHKCSNIEDLERVKNAPTPRDALQIAKTSVSLRWYWDMQCRCGCLFKEEVMLKALLLKFSPDQGPENRKARYQLLSAGTCQLVETSHRDEYWGTGSDHKGRNRLGYLLEHARRIIVKEEFQKRGLNFNDYYEEESF